MSEAVMEALSEFYGPVDARLWLRTEHRLLGGRRPVDCTEEEVLAVIAQLQDGAFV